MVVWRITGTSIGHDDCGAAYFATKEEAMRAKREYESDEGGPGWIARGPEKIVIRNRADLAWELNHAMGYGAS